MRRGGCHDLERNFSGEEQVIFADVLSRFAEQSGDRRLAPIVSGLTAPVGVRVLGRPGVGRRTVAAALGRAGVPVAGDGARADVTVLVICEALKPEDAASLAAQTGPVVTVLNKADLSGVADGGPMARARAVAADCRARTGVRTEPMIGLLACAELDDELLGALRTLLTRPADLRSTDAFLHTDHAIDPTVRRRLLATLDRFGIAHAVLALDRSDGGGADALPGLLRRLSGIDGVVAAVDEAAAPLRYRRLCSALARLQALVVESADPDLSEFLAGDDTVLAVMSAAVDVVQAAGLTVDPGDDRAAHLRRAVRWRRYGAGPVDALHRRCAADITRGSLRLLDRSRPGGDTGTGAR
jgi:hypothetical protein